MWSCRLQVVPEAASCDPVTRKQLLNLNNKKLVVQWNGARDPLAKHMLKGYLNKFTSTQQRRQTQEEKLPEKLADLD